jgi:hypothetical protein
MPGSAPETPNLTRIRRENALRLLQAYVAEQARDGVPPKGLEQAFAARLQVSPSTWSQLKNQRPISDKMARQIERLCGREPGWLDVPPMDEEDGAPGLPDAAEERLVAEVRAIWRAGNARTRRALRTAVLAFKAEEAVSMGERGR